jgi:hypothetical protein
LPTTLCQSTRPYVAEIPGVSYIPALPGLAPLDLGPLVWLFFVGVSGFSHPPATARIEWM